METSPTTKLGTAPAGSGTEIRRSRVPQRNDAVTALAAQAARRIAAEAEPAVPVAAFQSSI